MSFKNVFFKNFSLKLLSLLLAISLWLFANLKATADRTMKIPVLLDNLPTLLVITNTVSDYMNVRVDGPRRILSNLDPNVFPVHLDLSDAKIGVSNYQINEKMVQLPAGLRVTILPPDVIQVKLEPNVSRDVLVKPNIKEVSLPQGFALEEVDVNPKVVAFSGAKSEISGLSVVDTEEIDLTGRTESFEIEVGLAPKELHVWPSERGRNVKVRVTITAKILQREMLKRPVVVKNAPEHAVVQPAYVDVFLEGPADKLERITPSQVRPEVLIPKGKGPFLRVPVVVVIPGEGVRAQCHPDRVTVTLYE
jgi:YbbR domain-containing protein